MIKIENEGVAMFDVDNTLVMHSYSPCGDRIEIRNPYSGTMLNLGINRSHVELLKQMHGRGRMIGVWSGGGVKWAETVVNALGLEPYVHLLMTKPITYVDDMEASKWMNNHIYLGEG